jgi:hypothetical protein
VRVPDALRKAEHLSWRIEAGGFYGTGDVWWNGRCLGRVDGQYLGFSLPVGDRLTGREEGLLAIRLTNRCASHVLPGLRMPDFLLHGGLAGGVRLMGLPRFRLRSSDVCIRSCEVGAAWEVRIDFAVENEWDTEKKAVVQWEVVSPSGDRAGAWLQEVDAPPGGASDRRVAVFRLNDAVRWSPDTPALYTARCRVFLADERVDEARFRFGIRTAEFRADAGFFLNGKRLELRGCNRHESIPGLGSALSPGLHRMDARLLKEMGCNFVRLSHYPQHPAFLDACDELGMLVYPEIATWKSVRTGRWLRSATRQMHDLVVRDRNRPSVILWGMGNESRSLRAYRTLSETVKALDADRPVTYAENHLYRARREGTVGLPDVWGCNYELDILEQCRDASRRRVVVVSECSNYPPGRRGDMKEEAAQLALIRQDLAVFMDLPYVAGFALWSWNDYATLRKKRYLRQCGIVDAWRQPKLAAWYLKAMTDREPVLRLDGDWGRAGGQTARCIHLITNCAAVRVAAGGVERSIPDGSLWVALDLPFAGSAIVVAGMWRGNRVEASLEPWGKGVRLAPRLGVVPSPWAPGEAWAIDIDVTDGEGRRDHSWQGDVEAESEGPVELHCFAPDGKVPISGGTGRLFVSARQGGARVAVVFRRPDMATGRVEWQLPGDAGGTGSVHG